MTLIFNNSTALLNYSLDLIILSIIMELSQKYFLNNDSCPTNSGDLNKSLNRLYFDSGIKLYSGFQFYNKD